jgi:hypothetical protein
VKQDVECPMRDRPEVSEADLRLVDEIADSLWVPLSETMREILAEKVAARVMEACQEMRLNHSKPL